MELKNWPSLTIRASARLRLVIYSSASYPGFVIWRKLSPSDPSFSWVFAIEALACTTATIAGFWYFISLPPFFRISSARYGYFRSALRISLAGMTLIGAVLYDRR